MNKLHPIHELRRTNYRLLLDECFEGKALRMATKMGIKATSLSRLFSKNIEARRNIGNALARDMERAAKKPVGWLDISHQDAVDPVASRRAPLLPWFAAVSWALGKAASLPRINGQTSGDFMMCPLNAGPRVFCLKVAGEANTNPARKLSVSDGEVIYVDPDAKQVSGKLVVVKMPGHKEPVLRELVVDGGDKWLQATNPKWPERLVRWPKGAVYCGSVIGKLAEF